MGDIHQRLIYIPAILTVVVALSFFLFRGDGATAQDLALSSQASRSVAAKHLAQVTAQARAHPQFSGWTHATLTNEAFPIYRPDVNGIAYYEFPVEDAVAHKPAGYILVSTGLHDFQIVGWSTQGESYVQRLQALAKGNVSRVYLLDALSFVAEGRDGSVVASVGTYSVPTEDAAKWAGFKESYRGSYRTYNEAIRKDASAHRQKPGIAQAQSACGTPSTYRFAGTVNDQPLYTQIPPHQSPNTSGCFSGCGATAWATLFAWAADRALNKDPVWISSYNLWGNGKTAPLSDLPWARDPGVDDVTWQIRQELGTQCTLEQQGLTWPGDMDRARAFLVRSNSSPALVVVYDETGIATFSGTRNDDVDRLIDRDVPAVILLGWEHYPIAFGHGKNGCGDHMFYINDGHGNLSWTSAGTSFVGWIEPYPPEPPCYPLPKCPNPLQTCVRYKACAPKCDACIDPGKPMPPDPSRGCRDGFKCCEPGENGKPCQHCVPERLACP